MPLKEINTNASSNIFSCPVKPSLTKISIPFWKGIIKSYEGRIYESVDDKSLSYAL